MSVAKELRPTAKVLNWITAGSPYTPAERLVAICIARRMRPGKDGLWTSFPGSKAGRDDTGLQKKAWLDAAKGVCGEPVTIRTSATIVGRDPTTGKARREYAYAEIVKPALFRRKRRKNGGWLYEFLDVPPSGDVVTRPHRPERSRSIRRPAHALEGPSGETLGPSDA